MSRFLASVRRSSSAGFARLRDLIVPCSGVRWAWLLLFVWGSGWAATKYIRPVADCPNNGDGTAYACAASGGAAGARSGTTSFTSAWQIANLSPGDTVKACGNFVQADAATVTSNRAMVAFYVSGTDGSPIIFDGDCSADGGPSVSSYNGNYTSGSVIRTEDETYWTIRNLDLSGAKDAGITGYATAASEQATAKHIIIESSVVIHDIHEGSANRNGLTLSGTHWTIGDYSTTGNKIQIYDVGTDAINWYSSGQSTVDGANIYEISEDDANGDCVHVARRVDGDQYLDVDCDKTNTPAKQCVVSSTLDAGFETGTNRVERLRCLMNGGADWAGGSGENGVYTENPIIVKNSYISNPTSYGIVVGLRNDADLDASGNIIVNPGEGCFAVRRTSASGTANINNNTCLLTADSAQTSYGINAEANTKAVIARNNALIGPFDYGIYRGASGTVDDHNDVYGATTPYSDNGVAGSAGTGDIAADPLFVGGSSPSTAEGFRPSTNSPLCGAGAYTDAKYDYNHERMPLPRDIGALNCRSSEARTRSSAGTRTARTIN